MPGRIERAFAAFLVLALSASAAAGNFRLSSPPRTERSAAAPATTVPALPAVAAGVTAPPTRAEGAVPGRSLAAHAGPAAQTPREQAAYEWLPSEYRALTRSWQEDLLSRVDESAPEPSAGGALRRAVNGARNYAFILRARGALKPIKDAAASGAVTSAEARKLAAAAVTSLRESPIRPLYDGSLYRTLNAAAANAAAVQSQLLRQRALITQTHRQFAGDWNGYKTAFGERYFTESGKDRALMNVVAMKLFARFNGVLDQSTREAVNGIALLHPVTDDLIDSGTMKKETLAKITRRLQGIKDPAEHEYEKLVFALIDRIHARYPREAHPMLDWLLNDLWRAQLESAAQKGPMTAEAANLHTIKKGGLSTSAFGYIALGGLTPRQYEFFFRGGSLYQWMDDFSDIEADRREGIETLWTNGLARRETLARRFGALFEIKNDLLSREAVFSSFKDGAGLRDFIQRGFYLQYLTAAATNAALIGTAPYGALARRHSISERHVVAGSRSFLELFERAVASDDSGFTAILERFLLGGKTAAQLRAPRLP